MSCNCKTGLAIYAKMDNYIDNPHCVECKYYDMNDSCNRYKSMITGQPVVITCATARADDRLCGCLGVHWEKKE